MFLKSLDVDDIAVVDLWVNNANKHIRTTRYHTVSQNMIISELTEQDSSRAFL